MKLYEEQDVVKKEKVLKFVHCDTCKRDVHAEKNSYYYVLTTTERYSYENGFDINYYDFCNYTCMEQRLQEIVEDANNDSVSVEIELESKENISK